MCWFVQGDLPYEHDGTVELCRVSPRRPWPTNGVKRLTHLCYYPKRRFFLRLLLIAFLGVISLYAFADEMDQWEAAVEAGDIEQVSRMLSSDFDVNADVNGIGWTALHLAARDNNERLVRILLDAGAEVNAKTANGKTPIILLVRWAIKT